MIDRDTIIKMARKAGLHRNQHNLASNPVQYRFSYDGYEENLERFAALVAAAEREACASICEEYDRRFDIPEVRWCAQDIRARSAA